MPRSRREPDHPTRPEGESPEAAEADALLSSGGKDAATFLISWEVKTALSIRSDYALAKMLGVTKATVSRWSTGKGGMSDEVALRAAALTGRDPAYYLLQLQLERAEGAGVRAVLQPIVGALEKTGRAMIRKVRSANTLLPVFAVLTFSALFSPGGSEAASFQGQADSPSLYIMFNYGRKWIAALKRLLGASPPGNVTAPAF